MKASEFTTFITLSQVIIHSHDGNYLKNNNNVLWFEELGA